MQNLYEKVSKSQKPGDAPPGDFYFQPAKKGITSKLEIWWSGEWNENYDKFLKNRAFKAAKKIFFFKFPSKFHAEPIYGKETPKSNFLLVNFVNPIG